jgi:hypothetical protein
MSVLRPQADCGGASSRPQQSRARCEQVRMTAAIFFAKTKMGWIDGPRNATAFEGFDVSRDFGNFLLRRVRA